MKCTVCNHNQIKEIDRALLTGATLTSLNQKFGLSTSALHRHKDHLYKKMHRAEERLQASLLQGLLFKLTTILELVMQTVFTASAEGNSRLLLRAGSLGSRLIKQINKMDVPLEPETIYCLLASPKWNMTDSLLPGAFQALSDTRQTLATDLLAPCADLDPEPALELAQTSPLETPLSELEILLQSGDLDDQTRDLLYKEFPSLVQRQTAQPEPEYDKLENRWEKTGKSPGKIPLSEEYNEEYQEDMLCEKNAGKNSPSANSSSQLAAENEWDETGKLPKYSCNSKEIWEEHQKFLREVEQEENARKARTESAGIPPANPGPAPDPSKNLPLETQNLQPETPLNRLKNIPDRHWEEDFGNPRKFKGCY